MRWQGNEFTAWLPDDLSAHGMDALEQGGLLLGAHGSGWLTVHHFTTPGPLDVRTADMFLLLDPSHEQELQDSNLDYLGFWHSHPAGTPSDYSPEDLACWRTIAGEVFPQLPDQTHLLFPIITGDRSRVWTMTRDLTLTELGVTNGS